MSTLFEAEQRGLNLAALLWSDDTAICAISGISFAKLGKTREIMGA
jgi:hypothetical protein